jgi:protein-tyrosine phosphatase
VFVQELGVPRLFQIYVKASFLLLGENPAHSMGDITHHSGRTDSFSNSPRSGEEDYSDKDEFYDDEEESEEEKPQPTETVVPLSGKRTVPKLLLPNLLEEDKTNRRPDPTEKEFQRLASEELTALAQNLGETYMTQDLTALLSYLQDDNEVQARKQRVTVAIAAGFDNDMLIGSSPIYTGFKDSCYYKIKSTILKAFARLTKYWEHFEFVPNPVNLLFSELLLSHKDNLCMYDADFTALIYQVLANYANYVSYLHCYRWKELTRGMSMEKMRLFRRKADKFVWRIYNRLAPAFEAREMSEVETQLTLLIDYMRHCPTSITSVQVADVCMEILLKIKEFIISKGRITPNNLDHFTLVVRVIEVFDEIVKLNTHREFNDVLYSLLVERRETWRFFKQFTCQVLLNKSLERSIVGVPRTTERRDFFRLCKQQVVRHNAICFELILRQLKFINKELEKSDHPPNAQDTKEMLEKNLLDFENLISPNDGYLLPILSEVKGTSNGFELQREILRFLILVFSEQNTTFIKNKAYIDAYVSYAYLGFIKLYHSLYFDPETLELIVLHLKLLLAFSMNKTEHIILKFYQLRVMDFLVGTITLEYEITQRSFSKKPIPIVNTASNDKLKSDSPPDPLGGLKELALPPLPGQKKHGSKIKHEPPEKTSKKTRPASMLVAGSGKSGTSGVVIPTITEPKISESATIPNAASRTSRKNSKAHRQSLTLVPNRVSPVRTFSNSSEQSYPELPGLDKIDLSSSSTDHAEKPKLLDPNQIKSTNPSTTSKKKDLEKSNPSKKDQPKPKQDEPKSKPKHKLSMSGSQIGEGRNSHPAIPAKSISANKILPQETTKIDSLSSSNPSKDSTKKTLEKPSPPPIESSSSEESEEYETATETSTEETSTEESSTEETEESSESEPKPTKRPSMKIPSLKNVPLKGEQALGKVESKGGIPKLSLTAEMVKGGEDNNAKNAKNLNLYENDSGHKLGNLSQLESKIDKNDPKWQLIFNKKKDDSTAKEQPGTLSQSDIQAMNKRYMQERKDHKIYAHTDVQVTILQLIFSLMLTPWGSLETRYSDQFPLDNKKLNIPFFLRTHINHPANQSMIPLLSEVTQRMGRDAFRLLKLLCTRLFRKDLYNDLHRLAIGAYGTVYRCRLKPDCQTMSVAIKLMEVPKSIHDRCVIHDIFDEILILDRFKDDSRISHAYDFGTDDEYYWITMRKYKCSLKYWRQQQTAPFRQNLALYLNIYMNILNTFQFLTENKVNHFDVKCDNFLIQPLNEENWSVEDEQNFWQPTSDVPNFSVCLADFGEAKVYDEEIDGYTTRNRGTEFTKSPEMLVVAYASQKTRNTYDRRKKVGASAPSDVWSLGCLLYELLTGEFLFYDQDWVRFFIRVTSQGQELITPEKIEKIDNNPILVDFIRFILTRDPLRRPSTQDVIKRFKWVREKLTSTSAGICPRLPTPRDREGKPTNVSHSPSKSQLGSHQSGDPEPMARFESGSPESTPKNDHHLSHSSESNETPKKIPSLAHSISHSTLPIPIKPKMQQFASQVESLNEFGKGHSFITKYLYMAPACEVYQRQRLNQLGITHMINCTDMENIYPLEFLTFNIPLSLQNPNTLRNSIDALVSFITEAKRQKGKVMVYSQHAISRGAVVVIAYLMATRNWNYFQAFIFVKEHRYIIDPDEAYIKVLCQYHHHRQYSSTIQFQCLCGACSITVTSPFNQSSFSNPFPCSCNVSFFLSLQKLFIFYPIGNNLIFFLKLFLGG